MEFAAVHGITLHYAYEGSKDKVPLVFLNSLGGDLRIWNKLLPFFTERHLLIRYDKRGHGLSDAPPGPYTIRDHTHDLAGLLDHLDIQQAVLIGVSVGGMIALDFAANHPQHVKALVLCDTAAKIGTDAYWQERITAILENGIEHLAETILSRWFAPTFPRQHPAAYQGFYNMLTRTSVTGYTATCAAIRDADLRLSVTGIEAPALVLCGAEDSATPPALVRELAQQLRNGRFQLIEQAGHTPSVEQPATMASYINQFLQELA